MLRAGRRGRLCRGRTELRPEGYLSPATSDRDIAAIGKLARKCGLAISGICTLLQLSYPLTAADPARRAKGLELTGGMIRAAGLLETENVLVIPGVVSIAWPERYRAGAERRLRPPRPRSGEQS